jgi:pimeloyl-ACP methyl ester carboxylesterase
MSVRLISIQTQPMNTSTRTSAYDAERQTRQFVTLGDDCFAYIEAGDKTKPALVLVHGWLSHAGFWHSVIEALQATHYIVAIDLLGFGFSDKPDHGDYTIPAQARRVLGLLDHLGIDHFDLMGHSMGGQIGLQVALLAPQRIHKLVTVGGVVTGELTPYFKTVYTLPMWAGYLFPSSWAMSRFAMRKLRWYKYIFVDNAMTYRKDVIPADSIDVDMGLVEGIERSAYPAFRLLRKCDLTIKLPQILTPTLIVHGKQDNTVPFSSAQVAAKYLPNRELVAFESCGHTPNAELPDAFFAVVTRFLA